MLTYICQSCEEGYHHLCYGGSAPPPGMIGGSQCICECPEKAVVGWVGQEDAEGCALAVIAMLIGETYGFAKSYVDSWSDEPHDWGKNGTSHYTIDRALTLNGYWIQRRYQNWGCPLEPFAAAHYASVRQPSNNSHFVFVDAKGDVLDPLREGVYRLHQYAGVNQLVGVMKP
jgi:hypothetical protein